MEGVTFDLIFENRVGKSHIGGGRGWRAIQAEVTA